MNTFIIMSALIVACSATDLYSPTLLNAHALAAPAVALEVAAPAITSYQYETRQVHPGPAIVVAAPLHAHYASAPLVSHLSAPYAAPALLSAPKLLSAPLYSGHLAAPIGLAAPNYYGKTFLIKK